MDFQRFFLFLIFTFALFFLWDGWQKHQHPEAYLAKTESTPAPTQALQPATPVTAVTTEQKVQPGQKIVVKTDYLQAEINTVGGDLRHLEFLNHQDTDDISKPFVLLQQHEQHTYMAQTGLLGPSLPTHNTVFSTQSTNFQLSEGKDSLEVRLQTVLPSGVVVYKVFTFHRSSYLIDVGY